jgi:hypothetical protein
MGVSSWLAGFKPRRILSTADDEIVHDLMTSAADRAYRGAQPGYLLEPSDG